MSLWPRFLAHPVDALEHDDRSFDDEYSISFQACRDGVRIDCHWQQPR